MDNSNNISYHAGQAKGQTQEKTSNLMSKAGDTTQSAKDSITGTGQQMKAKAQGATDSIKDAAGLNK